MPIDSDKRSEDDIHFTEKKKWEIEQTSTKTEKCFGATEKKTQLKYHTQHSVTISCATA